jgi:hypothetical protein
VSVVFRRQSPIGEGMQSNSLGGRFSLGVDCVLGPSLRRYAISLGGGPVTSLVLTLVYMFSLFTQALPILANALYSLMASGKGWNPPVSL